MSEDCNLDIYGSDKQDLLCSTCRSATTGLHDKVKLRSLSKLLGNRDEGKGSI